MYAYILAISMMEITGLLGVSFFSSAVANVLCIFYVSCRLCILCHLYISVELMRCVIGCWDHSDEESFFAQPASALSLQCFICLVLLNRYNISI